jgi:hypothetical protein
LGLIVKFCPAQIAPEFTVMLGFALTIKLVKACELHPVTEFVPATVKEVLLAGDDVMLNDVDALLQV